MLELGQVKSKNIATFASEEQIFSKHIQAVRLDRLADPKYSISAGGFPIYSDCSGKTAYLDTSERHGLVISTSGAGKTQLIAALTVICNALAGESQVVTDPKGELISIVKTVLGDRVRTIVLDFRGNKSTDRYDLLADIKGCSAEELPIKARKLAHEIAYPISTITQDEFWYKMSESIISGIILLMAKVFGPDDPRFCVKQLFHLIKEGFRKSAVSKTYILKSYFDKDENASTLAGQLINEVLNTASVTAGGILSTLNAQLDEMFSSNIDMLSGSTFTVEELVETPSILFLLTPDESDAHNAVIRLVIDSIYRRLTQLALKSKRQCLKRRMNFVLEEYCMTPIEIDKKIAVCRSRGIRLMLFIQSYAQLIKKIGKDSAEAVLSNVDCKMYLHSNDKSISEHFSDLCGITKSTHTGSERPLVSSFMLRHLPFGAMLLLNGRELPFFSMLEPWFKISSVFGYDKLPQFSVNELPDFIPEEIELIDVNYFACYGKLRAAKQYYVPDNSKRKQPSDNRKRSDNITERNLKAEQEEDLPFAEPTRKKTVRNTQMDYKDTDLSELELYDRMGITPNPQEYTDDELKQIVQRRQKAHVTVKELNERELDYRANHKDEHAILLSVSYVFIHIINSGVEQRVRYYFEKTLPPAPNKESRIDNIINRSRFMTNTETLASKVRDELLELNVPCDVYHNVLSHVIFKTVPTEDV